MVVVRRAFGDAAVLQGHVQRGAVHQLPGVAAVHFLPWGLAGRHPQRGQVALAAGDLFVGHQHVATAGLEVNADHVTGLQPAQAAANCARWGRPMRPAVQSPDPMI